MLNKLCNLGLLEEPGPQTAGSSDATGWESGNRKRCARKRNCSKWAGVHAGLKLSAQLSFPSYSPMFFRWTINCTTQLELRDYYVFVIMETCLSDDRQRNTDNWLANILFRQKHTLTGKTLGGALMCLH